MKKFMVNKKADVAITLLVVMTLVVAGAALFIFITSPADEENIKINTYKYLDGINEEATRINLIVQDIVEKSASGISTEKEFIDNFKKELNKYKDKQGSYVVPELEQVEEQVKEENIELDKDNGKISLELEITIKNEISDFSALHTYKKKFSAEI